MSIKYDNKLLIETCYKILKLSKGEPYKSMDPKTKYLEIFPLYQEFAVNHPVVFKTIIHENKFSKKAFEKYMRLYCRTQISRENHAKLGASYLMFVEEAKSVHPDRKKLMRYKQECLEEMQEEVNNLNRIEKEERDNYKKKEEERLEENRKGLYEFFKTLNLKEPEDSNEPIELPF